MNDRSPRPALHQAMAALLLAAAWACYLPLGMKYATVLGSIVCAVFVLQQQPRTCLQQAPGLLPSGILLGWLALTALWTPASGLTVATHIGRYGLLLLVPLLACTCPPAMARRGLQHFVLVSALVGALLVLARMDLLPQSPWLWHTSVNAEGNQRIANSILLALGACLALWHLLHPGRKSRWAWALAGSLCMAGLAFQDRRTGMLLLPVLLLAWALARQPDWKRRLAGTAVIVVAAIATWQLSEGVRGRFAEGLTELQQFTSDDRVTTSWGQRLRMWEWTITMVQERPLVGHGVGSWQILCHAWYGPGRQHHTPQRVPAAGGARWRGGGGFVGMAAVGWPAPCVAGGGRRCALGDGLDSAGLGRPVQCHAARREVRIASSAARSVVRGGQA